MSKWTGKSRQYVAGARIWNFEYIERLPVSRPAKNLYYRLLYAAYLNGSRTAHGEMEVAVSPAKLQLDFDPEEKHPIPRRTISHWLLQLSSRGLITRLKESMSAGHANRIIVIVHTPPKEHVIKSLNDLYLSSVERERLRSLFSGISMTAPNDWSWLVID